MGVSIKTSVVPKASVQDATYYIPLRLYGQSLSSVPLDIERPGMLSGFWR